jgi:hypothetical protein
VTRSSPRLLRALIATTLFTSTACGALWGFGDASLERGDAGQGLPPGPSATAAGPEASSPSGDGDGGADAWPPWPATDDSGCPQQWPSAGGDVALVCSSAGDPCRQVSRTIAGSFGRACRECDFAFVYPQRGDAAGSLTTFEGGTGGVYLEWCVEHEAGPAEGYDWFCCLQQPL